MTAAIVATTDQVNANACAVSSANPSSQASAPPPSPKWPSREVMAVSLIVHIELQLIIVQISIPIK
jgi:hypothetical protein